jgi:hypothetical protein
MTTDLREDEYVEFQETYKKVIYKHNTFIIQVQTLRYYQSFLFDVCRIYKTPALMDCVWQASSISHSH